MRHLQSFFRLSACAGLLGLVGMRPTMAQGTLSAWGRNDYGQLGNGLAPIHSNKPVGVSGMTGVIATAGGADHAMAVQANGDLWTWGYNNYGQLGVGDTTTRNVPVNVGLSNVVKVSGGLVHSLALRSDGTVWGWGYNGNGGLGNGLNTNSLAPVQAIGVAGTVAIAAGEYHSIALKNDGTVWGWGNNQCGQLGIKSQSVSLPFQINGLTQIVSIASGEFHTLALKSDGTVWSLVVLTLRKA